jgi:hypothetical protein
MENALMEANGLNARVLLFKDSVRIKAVGLRSLLSGASKVEKDILISQIVGLQFKKAGVLANGYIEFELQRWHEKSDKESEHDVEDVVISFKPGQQKAFEAFREMLVANMTSAGVAKAPSAATTDLDQLDKLASLRDRGIITEQEFGLKKKQLLGL